VISVVVPAHDEEAVLARGLRALTEAAPPGELEVVVVCNGCRDRSAEIARSFGAPVRVLETPVASKIEALNLGDQAATGFPRFYVDADVVLPWASLRRVADVLEEGPWLAAAPALRVDLRERGWPVRAFYAVWMRLPYFDGTTIGSGVYGLSEAGRRRFERFPDIVADDGYVRLLFAPEERRCVEDCAFWITPPRTLAGLVRIKTRTHKGNYELAQRFPELARNGGKRWKSPLRTLLRDPRLWPALGIYTYVMGRAKLAARYKLRSGDLGAWEREDESRSAARP